MKNITQIIFHAITICVMSGDAWHYEGNNLAEKELFEELNKKKTDIKKQF